MKERINVINQKYHLDLFFLSIVFFTLPIAHVTAIQNIALFLFLLLSLFSLKKLDVIKFMNLKFFISLFSILLILSILSLNYTIDFRTTFSEIRSEIIKPFVILFFMYIFILSSSHHKKLFVFYILLITLILHTIINLYQWNINGFWPFRAGGLLDNGGGERFGIYVTYTLAISISLFFTKYRKIALIILLLSIIDIVANNTRATYIGLILIIFAYLLFFYKNNTIKYFFIFSIVITLFTFIIYSKNLSTRYNIYNMINNIEYFQKYSPSEFDKMVNFHGLGESSMARISMWKSAILYRIIDPFTPLGYGRFLYGKQIKDIWKEKPENLPFQIYSQLHSDLMSILFSLGIVGLIVFVLFLFYFLKISYYIYSFSEKYKFVGVFLFLGVVGHLASMMFGSFFGDSEQIYFYLLYGFALSLYTQIKEENEKNKIHTCK
ncbi:O-antigen ligase family protein [Arcobacter sp.]|uniref:O-antigen ligase family protein n=1 Tax=Arcobacter sp. TaxID=1872629 RepID=UPI003D0ED212